MREYPDTLTRTEARAALERMVALRSALLRCSDDERAEVETYARRLSLLAGQVLGLCYHHTDVDDVSAPPIDEL